jgi:hypothetical protein
VSRGTIRAAVLYLNVRVAGVNDLRKGATAGQEAHGQELENGLHDVVMLLQQGKAAMANGHWSTFLEMAGSGVVKSGTLRLLGLKLGDFPRLCQHFS